MRANTFALSRRCTQMRRWNIHQTRVLRTTRPTSSQKTYFQDPEPPRKSSRWVSAGVLFGSFCLGYAAPRVFGSIDKGDPGVDHETRERVDRDRFGQDVLPSTMARSAGNTPVPTFLDRTGVFDRGHGSASTASHFCELPSNSPCEDFVYAERYIVPHGDSGEAANFWSFWGIYDGHAGSSTARLLHELLGLQVYTSLIARECFSRPYEPNDPYIAQTIKDAFVKLDDSLFSVAREALYAGFSRAKMIELLSVITSGSCALLAIYDQEHAVLRVANVGDSRAILGRWDDSQQKYLARPLSVDHTGFNQAEVERINREHPGEDVIDPETGRVIGVMVSRAFGDARWKWAQDLNRLIHEKYWGPKPRPDAKILTPPYLTAEPEIMEAQIQVGEHPDFLIMASDGFWDQMSNDDAIACVQLWLDRSKSHDSPHPGQLMSAEQSDGPAADLDESSGLGDNGRRLSSIKAADVKDEDTFYDQREGVLKWKTSPKNFTCEDRNCGLHLVRNALGGNRRDLVQGVLNVQPPLSRSVRDDITVMVTFFGGDAERSRVIMKKGTGRRTEGFDRPEGYRQITGFSATRSDLSSTDKDRRFAPGRLLQNCSYIRMQHGL